MAEKVNLSVIVPSFNEMINLRKGVFEKIEHFLDRQNYSYEVIIVDDGSDDGSKEFVDNFIKNDNSNFKLIKNPHTGKAGAVTAGMLKARGEVSLFTDMDQATPIEEVEKLLPYFNQGYDIVIGSRSSARKGSPITRIVMSRGMVILRKLMVGLRSIDDTQCGFKMFKKEAANNIFKKLYDIHAGFKEISGSNVTAGFDVELLLIAKKLGYKIKEVPVEWLYVETRRVSPIRDSINGLRDLLLIFKNKSSGKYNL